MSVKSISTLERWLGRLCCSKLREYLIYLLYQRKKKISFVQNVGNILWISLNRKEQNNVLVYWKSTSEQTYSIISRTVPAGLRVQTKWKALYQCSFAYTVLLTLMVWNWLKIGKIALWEKHQLTFPSPCQTKLLKWCNLLNRSGAWNSGEIATCASEHALRASGSLSIDNEKSSSQRAGQLKTSWLFLHK